MCFTGNSVESQEADMVYDLSSVIIHRGSSSERGHYISIVKDWSTQVTYRCDDDQVEMLEDSKFGLEAEDDEGNHCLVLLKPKCKIFCNALVSSGQR